MAGVRGEDVDNINGWVIDEFLGSGVPLGNAKLFGRLLRALRHPLFEREPRPQRFVEQSFRAHGTFGDLLTSRSGVIDDEMARVYGVGAPGTGKLADTELHARLGDLVADGQMSDADASDTVKSFVASAAGVSKSGLQARLHWAMRDRAEARRRQTHNVEMAIRWAVRPLIQANAPKHEIEEAAGLANGDVLEWDDIVPILRDEWDNAHGRRRRR